MLERSAQFYPEHTALSYADGNPINYAELKNTRLEAMKVNVLVTREGAGFHVDSLELYSARQREAYVKTAATGTKRNAPKNKRAVPMSAQRT